MVRIPTNATPFFLVYGCETVLPLEIQIPSLRVAFTTRLTDGDTLRLRLQELDALDDKRLQAQQQIELYQAWIFRAFNRKVRKWVFKKGDLVLTIRRPMVMTQDKRKLSIPPHNSERWRSWCRSTADSWRSTILRGTLLMIRLTLHLWSKLQDPRYLEECQRRASFFNGSHHGRSTPSRPNIIDIMMHDVNIE